MNRRNVDYKHRAPIAQSRACSISRIEHGLDDDVNANCGTENLPKNRF